MRRGSGRGRERGGRGRRRMLLLWVFVYHPLSILVLLCSAFFCSFCFLVYSVSPLHLVISLFCPSSYTGSPILPTTMVTHPASRHVHKRTSPYSASLRLPLAPLSSLTVLPLLFRLPFHPAPFSALPFSLLYVCVIIRER
jgi:hypothetical protein